mmetsp:Transcript_32644/g.114783  ORF Transcript_32644/g.114783 Transcript_32644/m.114783 type:complete len:203 (+) Transcript_32644:289-897(+)
MVTNCAVPGGASARTHDARSTAARSRVSTPTTSMRRNTPAQSGPGSVVRRFVRTSSRSASNGADFSRRLLITSNCDGTPVAPTSGQASRRRMRRQRGAHESAPERRRGSPHPSAMLRKPLRQRDETRACAGSGSRRRLKPPQDCQRRRRRSSRTRPPRRRTEKRRSAADQRWRLTPCAHDRRVASVSSRWLACAWNVTDTEK